MVIVLVSDNLADLLLQRAAIIDEDLQLGIIQAVDNSIETGQAVVGHLALDSGSFVRRASSESGGSEDASHHNAQQNGNELLEVVHW